ncbi:glycosyltransferase family 4 protein [Filimonas lacunae]|nr:glycosyltransferase family 4 protein [Filimonas lacunae]
MYNGSNAFITGPLARKVLTAGVQFKNNRGGIGGVIATYEKYFAPFYFVPTYKPQRFKPAIVSYYLYHMVRLVMALLLKPSIKIVHIHGAAKGSFYRKYGVFFIAKYVFRKRVIYHSHGSEFKDFYDHAGKISAAWIRHFFRRVDLVICLSESWKTWFLSRFEVKKIVVLENIVEKSVTAVPHNEDATTIMEFLFLGAIGDRKGVFDLLAAIKKYKTAFAGKMHLVVGGNGAVDKLTRFIEEEGLQELVTYKGWLTGHDKIKSISNSQVYILPSYNEGLPLSILEAMSFGKAIISTPVGGIEEIVKPGYNGYLVKPGAIDEIADAMLQCIQKPSLVAAMGAHSKKVVAPYYAEEVIPKLAAVYEGLLKR